MQQNQALEEDRAAMRRETLDPAVRDELFATVAGETCDKQPTWRDRLREMPTAARLVAAFVGVLGLVGLSFATMGVRPDVTAGDALRFGIPIAALLALLGLALGIGLRGYHQRPLGKLTWLVVGVALLAPSVLALVPDIWHGSHAVGSAAVVDGCFVFGLINGGLAVVLVWLFQRHNQSARWRMVSAAAAGGLGAFVALQLHCPAEDVGHLLLGHASVSFALAGLALLTTYLTRARRAGKR